MNSTNKTNWEMLQEQAVTNFAVDGTQPNSAIFISNYEEGEAKLPVLGIYNVAGLEVVHRERSVVVNPSGTSLVSFFTKSQGGAVLSALSALHTNRYEYVGVGFAFYSKEMPKAYSKRVVGYVDYMYAGDDAKLMKLRPEAGVNVIGMEAGSLKVTENITLEKASRPAAANEPEAQRFARQSFWKHIALSLILSGNRVFVSPQFWTGEADSRVRVPERTIAYIQAFMSSLGMTPEEATAAYQDKVVGVQSKRWEARVNAKLNNGSIQQVADDVAFLSTLIRVGNDIITVNDLLGKKVHKFNGRVNLNPNKAIEVGNHNIQTLVAMMERGFRLEFATS